MNYYNEIDPYAAQWLRNLIAAGHIAPGEVDERSIVEVQPDDLAGFTQCHFFAGIGVWSHALRQAGWPDDRPVWTGSCPCQPFSAAGKGNEFGDERHLWPAWFRLIRECLPVVVFGEQVASADALAWLDHVSTDMEAEGYAIGAVDTCAAGFGAPHIRQRLYFVADADQRGPQASIGSEAYGRAPLKSERESEPRQLADAESQHDRTGQPGASGCGKSSDRGDMGNAINPGLERHAGNERNGNEPGRQREDQAGPVTQTGATNGFWADAVWIACRDGKARPTQPGIFPLASGTTQRVGRLRAYGNAICAPQAAEFVTAFAHGVERIRA